MTRGEAGEKGLAMGGTSSLGVGTLTCQNAIRSWPLQLGPRSVLSAWP